MKLYLFRKVTLFCNSSISRRMAVLFIPIFIIICLVSSLVTYRAFSHQMESRIISDTETLVEKISESVNYTFDDIKSVLVTLARQNNIHQMIQNYATLSHGDKLALDHQVKELVNYANTFKPYITDIFIISERGSEYSMMPSFIQQYNFYEQDWFDKTLFESHKGVSYLPPHPRDYYFNAPYYDKSVISAVFPVRVESHTIGYVMCDIDIKRITYLLKDLGYFDGEHIVVTDENGNIIIDEDMQAEQTVIDRSLIRLSDTDNATSQVLDDNLFVLSKIRSNSWNVVAQIDYNNVTAPAKQLLLIYILVFALSILLFILCTLLLSRHIKKPINQLIEQMKLFGKDRKLIISTDYGDNEISLIGTQFEKMAHQINILIDEAYIYQIQKKEMEYDALVKQLNPHFLYNVLQLMLTEAVCSENEQMEDIINALAYLMRYTMDNTTELVTVQDEIDYAKNYLNLYKKRFETMFDYTINVEGNLEQHQILKFLLQPILENCFKHAFKNTKSDALISISVFTKNADLHLVVRDNGCGMSKQKLEALQKSVSSDQRIKSIGLKNTYQRIHIKYGKAYGLHISSELGHYTQIECVIPLIGSESIVSSGTD